MSNDTQAIFFFLALLGCVLSTFWDYWVPTSRSLANFRPGWAGLASFCFVFFWNEVKAS